MGENKVCARRRQCSFCGACTHIDIWPLLGRLSGRRDVGQGPERRNTCACVVSFTCLSDSSLLVNANGWFCLWVSSRHRHNAQVIAGGSFARRTAADPLDGTSATIPTAHPDGWRTETPALLLPPTPAPSALPPASVRPISRTALSSLPLPPSRIGPGSGERRKHSCAEPNGRTRGASPAQSSPAGTGAPVATFGEHCLPARRCSRLACAQARRTVGDRRGRPSRVSTTQEAGDGNGGRRGPAGQQPLVDRGTEGVRRWRQGASKTSTLLRLYNTQVDDPDIRKALGPRGA